ncbi:hypothetical protein ACIBK8_28240 [Streptomyces sp. NPDC050161]
MSGAFRVTKALVFASEAARDPGRFDALNDPAWLLARFTAAHGEQAVAG